MKVFIVLSAMFASALSMPDGPHPHGAAGYGSPHPTPHYHKYPEKEHQPPQPFQYQYGVHDEYTGTAFNKAEAQDAAGNLEGEYRVNLPDGRVQIVSYRADHENGYQADVRYEGEPVYPPEPKEGYGHKPKSYAAQVPHRHAPAPYAPSPAPLSYPLKS